MNAAGPGFWPLALGAAGLLLFLVAAGTLLFGKKEGGKKLGCGFAVLAGLVWTLGLAQVTDWISAGRLALGLVLLLGVVEALRHDGGARVARAAAFLILGILLAGPVAYQLIAGAVPTERNRYLDEREEAVAEVRDRLQQLESELVSLQSRRAQVRADLAGLGHANFDELRADPRGVPLLQELARIDQAARTAESSAAELREALPQLEEQLARARDPGAAADPIPPPDPATGYEREAVRTIEELEAEEELRALFEREFPGG